MVDNDKIEPVTYDSEYINVTTPTEIYRFVAPKDFVQYLKIFFEIKRDTLQILSFAIQKTEKENEQNGIETRDDTPLNVVCMNFYGDKLTTVKEAKRQIRKYYRQYDLERTTRPLQLNLSQTFLDFDAQLPGCHRTLILMDFFSLEIWSIVNYLREIGVHSNVPDVMERKLTKLLYDTLHTDKKLKVTGLNLNNYVQSYKPMKLSKHDLEYGKILIRLINIYAQLRHLWIDLVKSDLSYAKKFEITTYNCALLGNQYHDFRHKITRGIGGRKKAAHFADAERILYNYYLTVCNNDISADEIFNRMYDSEKGVIWTAEYEDIKPHISSQRTIMGLIRKWDKEKGIRRKRKTNPHRVR